ncbi:MAG: sulfatase-like hydrolase/transferase, partial [Oscillospiraceae bacterium]|nr:sulfatase-like hydrolase/transferase [Oscillospiraceae bacterium]
MKILLSLIRPLPLHDKAKKLLGMFFLLLFLASGTVYLKLSIMSSWLIAAVPFIAIGIGMLRYKIYLFPLRTPPVLHVFLLYVSMTFNWLEPAEFIAPELYSEHELFLGYLSTCLFIFFTLEYLFGIPERSTIKEFRPAQFWKGLVISSAFFFTLIVFLPSEMYFNLSDEFHYTFRDFAPYVFKWMLLCTLAAAVWFCNIRGRVLRVLTKLFTGLLLCIYCQYMFMNRSLPVLGVETVSWDAMTGQFLINGIIWLLLLAAPFLLEPLIRKLRKNPARRAVPGVCLLISCALGTIQLLILAVLMLTSKDTSVLESIHMPSCSNQFVVSRNQNIITFIFDMMDQKYYDEIYRTHPEQFDCMKDFTCYTNTAMEYDSTYLSIPAMLTGANTYPQTNVPDWYREICSAEPAQTFYQRLHDHNYTVNTFGQFCFFDYDYSVFSDLFDNLSDFSQDDLFIDSGLLDHGINTMIAYRALPLFFKQFVDIRNEFGNDAVILKNQCYYENTFFLEHAVLEPAQTDQNYFIVQHLNGTHQFTRGSFKENLQRSIEIANQYIVQMQEAGVYDDALIIITADHGEHAHPDNMPIFYIKRPHETHSELQFCS